MPSTRLAGGESSLYLAEVAHHAFGEAEIGVGEAMRRVQNRMMDNPLTSHPYYWSGFAVIGDATRPVTSR
jgi:CHAT domain-containing protein